MKTFLTMYFFSMLCAGVFSQNVGINANGASPNPEAILHLDVSAYPVNGKKGLLGPVMNTTERDASFPFPIEGLEIYNTDIHCKQFYNGTIWMSDCGSSTMTGCPFGMIDFGTFCMDSLLQLLPTDWTTAVDTCENRGLRLCRPDEWYIGCSRGAPNMGIAWEWVEDFVNENSPIVMNTPPCWTNWMRPMDLQFRFRCCRDR